MDITECIRFMLERNFFFYCCKQSPKQRPLCQTVPTLIFISAGLKTLPKMPPFYAKKEHALYNTKYALNFSPSIMLPPHFVLRLCVARKSFLVSPTNSVYSIYSVCSVHIHVLAGSAEKLVTSKFGTQQNKINKQRTRVIRS